MRIEVLAIASGALVLAGCAGGTGGARETTTVTAAPVTVTITAPPVTITATPPPPPGPSQTIPGEGTFRVGVDMQPGTYTSSPSKGGYNCWWYRLSDLSGSRSAEIEAGYGEGPQYVTIQPSDVAFKSEQCQTWQKVG